MASVPRTVPARRSPAASGFVNVVYAFTSDSAPPLADAFAAHPFLAYTERPDRCPQKTASHALWGRPSLSNPAAPGARVGPPPTDQGAVPNVMVLRPGPSAQHPKR